MGGQACVLYGAAEFSRDLDLALLPEPDNLDRLEAALAELDVEVIAVPPFSLQHLTEGLAVQFRCMHPEVSGLRIDLMAHMRGVGPFSELWERRTSFSFDDGESIEVLALPDLVMARKTQRDKDWPMIRRLVDVNYLNHQTEQTSQRVTFWLRELRSPGFLVDVASEHPKDAAAQAGERPLLHVATPEGLASGDLERALRDEEASERQRDEAYWKPLRMQIERLRQERARNG